MAYDLIEVHEDSLGPAMQACTPLQRRFVIALLELGDNNHTRAAMMAGSTASTPGAQRVAAHSLAHNPKVLAAIHEEAVARIASGKIMAVSKLLECVRDAPDWKDKLKAIDMLLNRAGMHTITEQRINGQIEHIHTNDDAIREIEGIAKYLKIEPEKLIGFNYKAEQPVIDGEFEEVKPEMALMEGLEDLL